MNEKPILFSGEMVGAILDGRKTQTRRVIKPQPILSNVALGSASVEERQRLELQRLIDDCPYGKPGDLLWVRETWQAKSGDVGRWWHEVKRDERSLHNWAWTNPVRPAYDKTPPKWLPSIHMPRRASRLTLRVADVRVERVQEITPEAIAAEGCPPEHHMDNCLGFSHAMHAWFEHLWDSINVKRGFSYDSNPWVWVVEFEQVG